MKGVGEKFPAFNLTACVSKDSGREFATITNTTAQDKWKVIFFWPMDFTFVCPTEIAEFGRRSPDFKERKCEVLGCSTDSHYVHLAWRNENPELKNLAIPMLADIKRQLSAELGILDMDAGVCLRATYIVDPSGTIRWVQVNDLKVGRNVDEVLRVVDALQTEQLTPCGWTPGEATLG